MTVRSGSAPRLAGAAPGVHRRSRLISAWRWLQFYHEWRGRDPSGADASLTFAEGDLAIAVLSLAGAWLAWWQLPAAWRSAAGYGELGLT